MKEITLKLTQDQFDLLSVCIQSNMEDFYELINNYDEEYSQPEVEKLIFENFKEIYKQLKGVR